MGNWGYGYNPYKWNYNPILITTRDPPCRIHVKLCRFNGRSEKTSYFEVICNQQFQGDYNFQWSLTYRVYARAYLR